MVDKFFFSPQPTPQTTNNYIIHFFEELAKHVTVVNYNHKPTSRGLDYLKFSFRSNLMVLNWPEDLIHLRFGFIQIFIAFFTFLFYKIKGGKIVWICHNKESHNKNYKIASRLIRSFMEKISNFIIVHSEDALQHFNGNSKKVYFLNHPVYKTQNDSLKDLSEMEVLIWGNITPYKGLSEFISSYIKYGANFSVTIIGKADKLYYKELSEKIEGKNIRIIDKFLNDEELNSYLKKAKIILLPYLNKDTFSSGSLIHSLNSNRIILGPAVGNFIDLANAGGCIVYREHKELIELIGNLLDNEAYYYQQLERIKIGINKYYIENSWEKFIKKFLQIVNTNTPKYVKSDSMLF